jgi:hypothetical protein
MVRLVLRSNSQKAWRVLYENASLAENRELMENVCSNRTVRGKTPVFELVPLFAEVATRAECNVVGHNPTLFEPITGYATKTTFEPAAGASCVVCSRQ